MEAKRILLGKQFLFFLVLLLILNGFFFLYQQTGMTGDIRFYGDAYSRRIDELSGYTWEEVVSSAGPTGLCDGANLHGLQLERRSGKYAVPPPGPGSPGAVCVSDFL